jgi:hypothetical protein
MNADPKRKPHRDDRDRACRARLYQEEALDDALKNTFPASDPVTVGPSTQPPAARYEIKGSAPDGARDRGKLLNNSGLARRAGEPSLCHVEEREYRLAY